MKKVFSLLLATALLLSVLAVPAAADASSESDGPAFTDIGHLDKEVQSTIEWLYSNGIMNGTGNGRFSPDAPFTRAMFVTMMARLENEFYNEPDMRIDEYSWSGSTNFSDVPQGRWDAPYVKWASENGIVRGVGSRRFDPTGIITVEQFAAIVGRFLNHLGCSVSWTVEHNKGWPPKIYDLSSTSKYAKEYVSDLLGANILQYKANGKSGVNVRPKHQLTRAEIAVMFADLYQLLCSQRDYGISKDTPWGTVNTIIKD